MRTTTDASSLPALESISLDALALVQGGCGKKRCCPQPAPQEPAPAPIGGTVASTSVQISGYGGVSA